MRIKDIITQNGFSWHSLKCHTDKATSPTTDVVSVGTKIYTEAKFAFGKYEYSIFDLIQ